MTEGQRRIDAYWDARRADLERLHQESDRILHPGVWATLRWWTLWALSGVLVFVLMLVRC